MKKLKHWLIGLIMNRSIRVKFLICMLLIALLTILIFCAFFYSVSYREQVSQARSSAQIKVEAATTTVDDSISTLYTNMVRYIESPPVTALFSLAQSGVRITANSFAESLDELEQLANTDKLIHAILLITPDGEYMSNRNVRLRPECQSANIWADFGDRIISWLPARPTPYTAMDKDVVALAFSFNYYKGFQNYIPKLVSADDEFVFRLFFFFDYKKLTSLLQSDDDDPLTVTYLAGDDMTPLSMVSSSRLYNVAADADFRAQALAVNGQGEVGLGRDSYLVSVGPPMFSGIRVVNITSRQELLSAYNLINQMIYLPELITILAAVALSALMTRALTQPLMKLVQSVRAIGSDAPAPVFVPHYNDEIGVLGKSVEQMRSIIKEQMQTIKDEERKRANAEIRMLTQQINPHFIYNTLDCIRWEILNNNMEGSSGMVESLAAFLRLGFGHSGETVTVREEVTRIDNYLNIMRQRLNGSTLFSSYIDPKLQDFEIPRMVLQPLVENSIKHGFSPDVFKEARQAREIYIRCAFLEEGGVSLAVEDNGAGIDIEHANEAVNLSTEDPSSSNIGLRNSYLRMRAYFGAENVRMRFSSVPFYLNRVEYVIQLPEKAD